MALRFPQPNLDPAKLLLFVVVMFVLMLATRVSAEITGFTEAYRSVDAASVESGVLTDVYVKTGDVVQAGQPIGQLDQEVQKAQLELARFMVHSEAELKRAQAELETKRAVVEHLNELQEKGFAQNKELLRANLELSIAQANLLAREERIAENKIRLQLAELTLKRRTILAPVGGVVATVHRQPGEFVSPVNPHIVTILQVEPMVARFQVNVLDIDQLRVDQSVQVTMENDRKVTGQIDSIGVIAESETVTVRVRLNNQADQLRSGQRCYLLMPPIRHLVTQRD
jgi:RND family efflux transporter MFP subunit